MIDSTGKDASPRSKSGKTEGDWGELVACDYLRAKGYTVMERNWKSGRYEIDIICRKGNRLVFVEVKTRIDSMTDPVSAVNSIKQKRIVAVADSYLKSCDQPFEYQFDIISITGSKRQPCVEHIEDAFFPSVR